MKKERLKMLNQFSRTQLLIGADAIKKLSESRARYSILAE